MKKIFVLFFVAFMVIVITFLSVNPVNGKSPEKVVPIYVNNFEIADSLESETNLFPVYRKVEANNRIKRTVEKLINIELTAEEKDIGFSTEWNENHSVFVKDVFENNGKVTIKLQDDNFFTSGGSSRIENLKKQIKKTVLQFGNVCQIEFIGQEHIFQP